MSESTPVMLVHGFLSSPAMMRPFRWQLSRYGHQVEQPELGFLCIQDVRKLAEQLGDAVERQCLRLGVDQVDLVGISQGGIIGLYYVLQAGGSDFVRRLVTVGSPVLGSHLAMIGMPVVGPISKGIRQLRPGARFLQSLTAPIPPETRVCTVSVRGDLVSPPHRCYVPGAAENRVISGPPGPFKHQWIAVGPAVVKQVHQLLSVD